MATLKPPSAFEYSVKSFSLSPRISDDLSTNSKFNRLDSNSSSVDYQLHRFLSNLSPARSNRNTQIKTSSGEITEGGNRWPSEFSKSHRSPLIVLPTSVRIKLTPAARATFLRAKGVGEGRENRGRAVFLSFFPRSTGKEPRLDVYLHATWDTSTQV